MTTSLTQPAVMNRAANFSAPVVVRSGSSQPDQPVVVLFHGRGGSELDMSSLARMLPTNAEYYSLRAPIEEGGGYAWFENRGIGRPVAESIRETMAWFRMWLDGTFAPTRPIIMVGFSGGAAFAGGLLLSEPQRFAGAALLFGTLPFDAGIPADPAQLFGVPVFLAHGTNDKVIPPQLLAATWGYLTSSSGSPVCAHKEEGGHELTKSTVQLVADWLSERIGFLGSPASSKFEAVWDLPGGVLPIRTGPRPRVSWDLPQQQLTQNAPIVLQEHLFQRCSNLANVISAQSLISVPGARAFMLPPMHAVGCCSAFIVPAVGEFAHIHPPADGSLHLTLPENLAAEAIKKGWAVAHPLAGTRLSLGMTMVFGPRDEAELDIVAAIVLASYQYAIRPA